MSQEAACPLAGSASLKSKGLTLEAGEVPEARVERLAVEEVLRRALPFDSGPLADEEIGAASGALFGSLKEEDAGPPAR